MAISSKEYAENVVKGRITNTNAQPREESGSCYLGNKMVAKYRCFASLKNELLDGNKKGLET
jgi:hypothetical protein